MSMLTCRHYFFPPLLLPLLESVRDYITPIYLTDRIQTTRLLCVKIDRGLPNGSLRRIGETRTNAKREKGRRVLHDRSICSYIQSLVVLLRVQRSDTATAAKTVCAYRRNGFQRTTKTLTHLYDSHVNATNGKKQNSSPPKLSLAFHQNKKREKEKPYLY